MKRIGRISDWFAVFFLVVLLYILVRPQSAAADLIDQFSKAMSALVRATTDI